MFKQINQIKISCNYPFNRWRNGFQYIFCLTTRKGISSNRGDSNSELEGGGLGWGGGGEGVVNGHY
jgi:uncharacterized membrane protein